MHVNAPIFEKISLKHCEQRIDFLQDMSQLVGIDDRVQ